MLAFPAAVDGHGRLKFDDPELRMAALVHLAGKRVEERIVREVLTRTLAQNRLLWGTYESAVAEGTDLIELATGFPVFQTSMDVHGFAKANLLTRPVETNQGWLNLLGTTTTLTTTEFSHYIELLVAKLAGYGVYIPPMGER